MITFQIKELCDLRGLKNPVNSMRIAGISFNIAMHYYQGSKKNLSLKHIEILCKLLRCTPNDLFVWTPDSEAENFAGNPLQQISRHTLPDLHQLIGTMNLDEVKKRLQP